MSASIQLIGLAEILKLSLFMMIPGQCFWTGLALAKHSVKLSTIFQLGCGFSYILVYGMLNEFGGYFLTNIDYNTLNILRGVALIGVGILTTYSIWKKKSESQFYQNSVWLKSGVKLKIFFLGSGLILANPMVYALLIPYTEPLVKLQYHWFINAIFMYSMTIFPVYMLIYVAASNIEKILTGISGKLFWSWIALFPIYYGISAIYNIV